MLRPTDIEKLKGNKSQYEVVIGVAKRAREYAEAADNNNEILLEKPVSMAINDLVSGEYKLMSAVKDED